MQARDSSPVYELARQVRESVGRVIVGKAWTVDLLLVALLCEGHVLIEDVPGIGKTTLAKALARSLSLTFKRIQCTPDLLPADITGTMVFNQALGTFEFYPGPVFTQVLLADEINRATPRTQAALLEAMEERQVSVEGEVRPLPRPFVVLATQNPIELEGTFPLPEAQLDRFFLKLSLGYPDLEEERQILRRFRTADPLKELVPAAGADQILVAQRLVREVHVSAAVEDYLLGLVRETRRHPAIELGASPRAALALYRAAQALAAVGGRDYVIPDDVKALAEPVLAHRLIPNPQARLKGRSVAEILREVVAAVPVPVEA